MELTLTTPAILFPTISLLMVAYTNRFLTLAKRIRTLHETYKSSPNQILMAQISSLRRRVQLIRNMQALGLISLFLCVLCMFLLFSGNALAAKVVFGAGLLVLMLSLALSFREVQLSVQALNLALQDMADYSKGNRK